MTRSIKKEDSDTELGTTIPANDSDHPETSAFVPELPNIIVTQMFGKEAHGCRYELCNPDYVGSLSLGLTDLDEDEAKDFKSAFLDMSKNMFPTLYHETKHLRYDPSSKYVIRKAEYNSYLSRISDGVTTLRKQAAELKKMLLKTKASQCPKS